MNPNNFESGINPPEKNEKELKQMLVWLDMERAHIPNILFGFKKLGWDFDSNKELYLAAIKIGFYDVIKKLKESIGTGYTADSIGHWGSHIGWNYVHEIKPHADDEGILAVGDALALLLARLYELSNNRQALDFYEGLGNTNKITELKNKNQTEEDDPYRQWKNEKMEDNDPHWQKEIFDFLAVAEKYNITEQERENCINTIKAKVESEFDNKI